MHTLFDSHCHLQDERIFPRIEEIVVRARAAGVGRMMCCGSAEADWPVVAAIGRRFPEVMVSFGLHPWYVRLRSEAWIESLRGFLAQNPCASVGEIGLDRAQDEETFGAQEEVFAAQLRLARELDRPVSLHCRRAWAPFVAILERTGPPRRGGAVHSFSGAAEMIAPLSSLGLYFSFSGAVTFDRNRRGRRSLGAAPAERLLVETDSPDIVPAGCADEHNEPANLGVVVREIAKVKGISVDEAAEITAANALRLFGRADIPAGEHRQP